MGITRNCVQVCVYVAFIVAVVVADQENAIFACSGPLAYYMDLGCMPVYYNTKYKSFCVKRFDCSHLRRRYKDKCYINGHEYIHNEILRKEDANVCDNCICKRTENINEIEVAAFECDKSKCAKRTTVNQGCYLRGDPSECCKEEVICPSNIQNRSICNVSGEYYWDGELFHVQNEPNLKCICQPGYNGQNVPPFCVKQNHSLCDHPAFEHTDYFRRNCAPIFINVINGTTTCYRKMKCQSLDDIVVPHETPFVMDDDINDMCLFGNMMLRIGDIMEPSFDEHFNCILCICEVPPVLSCKYVERYECLPK
ncbi:hypothetical protein ALC62_11604 [Cyphomyrmex costatus]|uniref:VWFC domain-containing protein n=1 Tax=Cyphomyrmex costatus TaxID=456900 RepID=A0A151IC88_9HYME|nr:hypothetical protein ALC62_11604 [Cyphomyrmex costatus]